MESISTLVGELVGRDAIHLDFESFDHKAFTLVLEGEFNDACCSELNTDNFTPYLITFYAVSDYRRIPIEEWYDSDETPEKPAESSFSSTILESFSQPGERTYLFETYDWVFKIRAKSYELEISSS